MDYKYKGNSDKSKDKPEIKQITSGKIKKKGIFSGFDNLISEDAPTVGHYVLFDVIFPAVKDLLYDVVTNGVNIILYGENRKRNTNSRSKISYNSMYDEKRYRGDSSRSYRNDIRKPHHSDIVVDTRSDAEHVLETLDGLIDHYGSASVADLYSTVGITPDYTDHKYGWIDTSTAKIQKTREGYIILLPKAAPIND